MSSSFRFPCPVALRHSLPGLMLTACGFIAVSTLHAQEPVFDTVAARETNVPDGFTVVGVGDVIMGRAVTVGADAELEQVLDILRAGDVTFANFEGSLIDFTTFDGFAQAEHGGAYHVAPPEVADDLRNMGIDLVNLANNHIMDWGLEGMRETRRHLERAGVVHAGTGETLGLARGPAYLETKGGRVALVGTASSFTDLSRAGPAAPKVPGRPGVNALRLSRTAVVTEAMLANLREVLDALPGRGDEENEEVGEVEESEESEELEESEDPEEGRELEEGQDPEEGDGEDDDPDDSLRFMGQSFKSGDTPAFTYEGNEDDVAGILRSVREGKQLSDFLILTQHAHEPGNWSREPADYLPTLVRSAIDEGADMFIGHGPHQLRGIEIYEGKPIFYSLGNFIFHDNLTPVPYAMFERYDVDPREGTEGDVNAAMGEGFNNRPNFESVITASTFEGGRVSEIRLYPIELRQENRLANRGVPRLASPETADRILERLQELSAPFGTEIKIEDHIGVIRPEG